MKLLAFRQAISIRLKLLWACLRNSYEIDTAYFGNNWGRLVATFGYTATYIAFINVVYANVHTLAGYTKNDMYIFLVISQIFYYTMTMWSDNNIEELGYDVNLGNLDLLLTKPAPALFYASIKKLDLFDTWIAGAPPLIVLALLVDWANTPFSTTNLLGAMIIFISGQMAINVFQFLLILPVFWYGEANNVFSLHYPFVSLETPYEAFPGWLRLSLSTAVPVLLGAGLTTSVLLGKTPVWPAVGLAVSVGTLFLFIKSWAWQWALRNYSSASS